MKLVPEKGFEKLSTGNLPTLDYEMLEDFMRLSLCKSVETRGVKASRATRANYGDEAVGWAQIHRTDDGICTVKAKMCHEHKIRDKGYAVSVIIDENNLKILEAKCHDCAASKGGCKHANAFVTWLHRRSEEESPTEVECYWRKSRLSSVGSNTKYMTLDAIAQECKRTTRLGNKTPQPSTSGSIIGPSSTEFLEKVLRRGIDEKQDNHLVQFFKERDSWEKTSMHYLGWSYDGDRSNSQDFYEFCKNSYTYEDCQHIANVIKDQSESPLWYETRYGRITTSIIDQSAHCRTIGGSLFKSIMGATIIDTFAMARGRHLEGQVIEAVEDLIDEKILRTGLLLSPTYPWFGASPDGVTRTSVIEVKCPSKSETVSNYYCNGEIHRKFKAQMQLQMLFFW
ncbi:uncharacterized protein LOC114841636 [Diachasma alloeum]|uniref:uncharacterized protein LOC114841636 n=1 Tax=Diachasma alloeum TaxID=454923 RepID=UPI0010FBA8BE|nr:uncharacterized protein LOC114841636 [Diachasma alloeum]